MVLTVALLAVIAALVMGLLEAHLRRIPAWDRPTWAWRGAGGTAWRILRRALLAVGLALLFVRSWIVGLAAGAILGAAWARMAWVRSVLHARRSLHRAIEESRHRHPGVDDHELCCRAVLERHPEWGPELVDRMVRDHPDLPTLARIVVRMERGWRQVG
jgi:hypothetical protein